MGTYELSDVFYKSLYEGNGGVSLFTYLEDFTSDEIGEIDLKSDSYTEVFRVGGKYSVPITNGSYSGLFDFVLNHFVHPEDKAIYKDLMHPKTLLKKLKASETPNFRFAQFRIKTQDDNYRYIEHCILTGEENNIAKGKIRFYIFDIHNMKGKELGKSVDDSQLSDFQRSQVTGLWNEGAFYKHASIATYKAPEKWKVIAIDLEHFKLFDEWYGRERGNLLLRKIGLLLREAEKQYGGIAGYFGQDDFVLVAKIDEKAIEKLYNQISECIISEGYSIGFKPTFGVAKGEKDISMGEIYDRASFASYRAKDLKGCQIYYYNPSIHDQIEQEYKILSEFMAAMKNNEIDFYVQPQCAIGTGKIVGAESLCRWRKKDGTFVSPAVFIPILEKYGFITDLDKHIWEKVCIALKNWIDGGHTPIPISVNISQVDLFTIDIPEHFGELTKKYGIPADLLKLEITESAYAENQELVNDTVDRLHQLGFTVLMDDFGSGYSSLNILSSLNIDIIKLDALFLNFKDEHYKKSIRILESIVDMAKMLALPVIVEGVETKEETVFLDGLGIRFVQGFYYYRALPREEFEALISNPDNIDTSGFTINVKEQFHIREFLDQNIYSDSMLNQVLGPVAIYLLKGEHVDIIRFNEQFFETVDDVDFHDRLTSIENFLPPYDRPSLVYLLNEAAANKFEGSSGVLHFYKTDGSLTTYFMRFYYLGDQEEGKRFYGSATNISEHYNLQSQMRLIAKYSSDSIVFLNYPNEDVTRVSFSVVIHGLEEKLGLTSEEFENELNTDDFSLRVEKRKMNAIKKMVEKSIINKKPYTFEFDVKRNDGKTVTIAVKGDPVEDPITGTSYIVNFHAK